MSTIFYLQYLQVEHDRNFHNDIYSLRPQDKVKHLRLILGHEIRINSITDDKQADQIWYYGPDGHGAYTPQQCDMTKEDWVVLIKDAA